MRGADADRQLLVRGRGAAACVVVAVVAVAVMLVAWFAQATCSAPRAQPLQGRKRERGDDAVSSGGRAAAGGAGEVDSAGWSEGEVAWMVSGGHGNAKHEWLTRCALPALLAGDREAAEPVESASEDQAAGATVRRGARRKARQGDVG